MAKKSRASKPKDSQKRAFRPVRWLMRWSLRIISVAFIFSVAWIIFYGVVNPPTTIFILQERSRLGTIDRHWVPIEEIAPVMARSVVAAEDANYCLHWGFDVRAIRDAIEDGGTRGASTITQQVVKNTFLWHGRSWIRKLLETGMTPLVEALWSKKRIIEVYLNVAEFDEGVFGVEAAARHYFDVGPEALSSTQAARLAAILPSPKTRSASKPSKFVKRRAASIADGAATIRADGRSACFES